MTNQRCYDELAVFRHIMQQKYPEASLDRILVLGCGDGREAVVMKQLFCTEIIGVDIHDCFNRVDSSQIDFIRYDGQRLPFPNDSFDLVYSYHVLEHTHNPDGLVQQVRRVLKPRGFFYIGVPNKDRVVGYFGMKYRSLWQKVTSNLRDWYNRFNNQWKNPVAHAGFSQTEIENLLSLYFMNILPVSRDYYLNKWPQLERFLHLLWLSGWHRRMSPSLYVIAQK